MPRFQSGRASSHVSEACACVAVHTSHSSHIHRIMQLGTLASKQETVHRVSHSVPVGYPLCKFKSNTSIRSLPLFVCASIHHTHFTQARRNVRISA